jgi:hypothetical protein
MRSNSTPPGPSPGIVQGYLAGFYDETTMSDHEPAKPGSNGRLTDGRFAGGNTIARGNPLNRRMATLRSALLDSTTPEDVQAVGAKLAELAKAGDVQAARVYLEHVIGKAPQSVELTGPDGSALGLDWQRVEAAVLAALQPFGEQARFAVALALRGVVNDAGRAEPTGDEA